MAKIDNTAKFIGAYTGFAVGDAFGYPCRDFTYVSLCDRFDKHGCTELAVSRKTNEALFSDATQLMLFTTEGLIWADKESRAGKRQEAMTDYVFYAYQWWLYSQTKTIASKDYSFIFYPEKGGYKSKLLKIRSMYKERYAGRVNVDALMQCKRLDYGKFGSAASISASAYANDDNGGLKRVLPAGLFFNFDAEFAFQAGRDFAAITHAAYNGCVSAGCYAAAVTFLMNGTSMDEAVVNALEVTKSQTKAARTQNTDAVVNAVEYALELIDDKSVSPLDGVRELGKGFAAEEALAISFYCAMMFQRNYSFAVQLAANHDGASDVCAALTGGLVGAHVGVAGIPPKWRKKLQCGSTVESMGTALLNITRFND
ncbi:ADP-ribosylglycohydrolase [Clostridia bacterium]|nr:ADP-ribosylglycohydrolase [Clostridia bacterium]